MPYTTIIKDMLEVLNIIVLVKMKLERTFGENSHLISYLTSEIKPSDCNKLYEDVVKLIR